MNLKAYNVFVGDSPQNCGCVLVYAENRNQAKYIGKLSHNRFFTEQVEYIEMTAIRAKEFDKYVKDDFPYFIDDNDSLPEGVEFFKETA